MAAWFMLSTMTSMHLTYATFYLSSHRPIVSTSSNSVAFGDYRCRGALNY